MRWNDQAIILDVKPHGDRSGIVSLLTSAHGRHMGLIHNIKSKKNRSFIAPGSFVEATWSARLEQQLGTFTLEPKRLFWSEFMRDPKRLDALLSSLSLLHIFLPERQAYTNIYHSLLSLLEHLDQDFWVVLYLRWEVQFLADVGFGLDLRQCALTGEKEALSWVSPLTGKAANYAAGLPWKDRLLKLPAFFVDHHASYDSSDILDGFRLTTHFFQQALADHHHQYLPAARTRLVTYFI